MAENKVRTLILSEELHNLLNPFLFVEAKADCFSQ